MGIRVFLIVLFFALSQIGYSQNDANDFVVVAYNRDVQGTKQVSNAATLEGIKQRYGLGNEDITYFISNDQVFVDSMYDSNKRVIVIKKQWIKEFEERFCFTSRVCAIWTLSYRVLVKDSKSYEFLILDYKDPKVKFIDVNIDVSHLGRDSLSERNAYVHAEFGAQAAQAKNSKDTQKSFSTWLADLKSNLVFDSVYSMATFDGIARCKFEKNRHVVVYVNYLGHENYEAIFIDSETRLILGDHLIKKN